MPALSVLGVAVSIRVNDAEFRGSDPLTIRKHRLWCECTYSLESYIILRNYIIILGSGNGIRVTSSYRSNAPDQHVA
jgi:hypothetical protein